MSVALLSNGQAVVLVDVARGGVEQSGHSIYGRGSAQYWTLAYQNSYDHAESADGAWRVVSAGPTTSVRENPYEPAFIAATGVRIIIGKGGMDAATLAAMKRHGCVYVQAVGGAGALYGESVKNVAGVSLLREFGAAEAIWHFDVEDFRGVVAMDAHGRSLFAEVAKASAIALAGQQH